MGRARSVVWQAANSFACRVAAATAAAAASWTPSSMEIVTAVVQEHDNHASHASHAASHSRGGSPGPARVPDSPVGADAVFTDDDDAGSTGTAAEPLVDLEAFWTADDGAGSSAGGGVKVLEDGETFGSLHELLTGMPSNPLLSPTKLPTMTTMPMPMLSTTRAPAPAAPAYMPMQMHMHTTLQPLLLEGTECSCGGGMFCTCIDLPLTC